MMKHKLQTILLGGCRGADGKFPFQRTVLFYPAGELTAHALPDGCEALYVRRPEEPELRGVSSRVSHAADFCALLRDAVRDAAGDVLVIAAPMPDVTREEYRTLLERHWQYHADATMLACAGARQMRHIGVFRAKVLRTVLREQPQSLTDCAAIAQRRSAAVLSCRVAEHPAVVTAWDAALAQKTLMRRVNGRWMERGVTIFDPDHTYIAPDCTIGAGTTILPGTMLYPGCTVGEGCTIGPNTVLKQAAIGDRTQVNASQISRSTIGSDAAVGPFAYVRPDCTVGDRTRIGDFVELKHAEIGNDTKVAHLTYIGDATVGERVNFGCGTVVVNYDGFQKHHTDIGDDCFLGCNTNLIAPVRLGDRAFTAAGTTVTENVPDGALAVARSRQQIKPDWNDRRKPKE